MISHALEGIGDCYRRTDELDPVGEADLKECLRADGASSKPGGEVLEEPLDSRWGRDNEQTSGRLANVLKRMWRSSRAECRPARGCPKNRRSRLESEISFKNDP